ncbi:amidohydrolase family protein [Mangrovimicrobium sediminis]|uniref:Amidohydrolase family protein n=1 Tax=Mangrovimicrobium sediminis TaxID=2562682 RepID=A0A4Z0M1W9_9GAMM|nr:amidohydrolase family protein [Haliea sp. SAOS-164]TGD73358.1 amidohydrolase family protein [Haliea sp. SAOS-164]
MIRLLLGLLMGIPLLASAGTSSVIRAAALLDVESGRMLQNPVVLVEGDKIVDINPTAVPGDAIKIDLPGMTLLPGFMDAHVHLTISDAQFHKTMLTENSASAALRAAQSARETLMGGFTTVRDMGQVYPSLDLITVSVADAIAKGQIIGPQVIASGHAIGINGGHVDPTMGYAEGRIELDWRYGVADGVEEAMKATRYQIKHGAKAIKISATAGVLSLESSVGAQQMTDQEMRAVVEEAERHGLKVAAHAHGADGIMAAVLAGVASIEHGSMVNRDIIREMKKNGTYLVPTTGLLDTIELEGLEPEMQAKANHILPLAADNLREAIKAGALIALGTDAPLVPHGKNAYEFEAMVNRGMTPLQSIQAGTIRTADLFGLEDRGKLVKGLRADIVAVPGNPLEDIKLLQQVGFVMKAGIIYRPARLPQVD